MLNLRLTLFCFFVSFALLALSREDDDNSDGEEIKKDIALEQRHLLRGKVWKRNYKRNCVRWTRFRTNKCPGKWTKVPTGLSGIVCVSHMHVALKFFSQRLTTSFTGIFKCRNRGRISLTSSNRRLPQIVCMVSLLSIFCLLISGNVRVWYWYCQYGPFLYLGVCSAQSKLISVFRFIFCTLKIVTGNIKFLFLTY